MCGAWWMSVLKTLLDSGKHLPIEDSEDCFLCPDECEVFRHLDLSILPTCFHDLI